MLLTALGWILWYIVAGAAGCGTGYAIGRLLRRPIQRQARPELEHILAVFEDGDEPKDPIATAPIHKRAELAALAHKWTVDHPSRPAARLAMVQPCVRHRFLNWIGDK